MATARSTSIAGKRNSMSNLDFDAWLNGRWPNSARAVISCATSLSRAANTRRGFWKRKTTPFDYMDLAKEMVAELTAEGLIKEDA